MFAMVLHACFDLSKMNDGSAGKDNKNCVNDWNIMSPSLLGDTEDMYVYFVSS